MYRWVWLLSSIKGPPLSPWQESLLPSGTPAQIMYFLIVPAGYEPKLLQCRADQVKISICCNSIGSVSVPFLGGLAAVLPQPRVLTRWPSFQIVSVKLIQDCNTFKWDHCNVPSLGRQIGLTYSLKLTGVANCKMAKSFSNLSFISTLGCLVTLVIRMFFS